MLVELTVDDQPLEPEEPDEYDDPLLYELSVSLPRRLRGRPECPLCVLVELTVDDQPLEDEPEERELRLLLEERELRLLLEEREEREERLLLEDLEEREERAKFIIRLKNIADDLGIDFYDGRVRQQR